MWLFEPLRFDPRDADFLPPPMDHGIGGHKPRQYTAAAARIVLARAARGETIASILAIPGMPCRRTLYDWIRDEPAFRKAWEAMRDGQAFARQRAVENAEPIRAIEAFLADEARGRPPGAKRGPKSTYTRAAAEAWCELIVAGATVREAGARPGMPNPPMVYRWLRNHPEFRAMYKAAAERRDFILRRRAANLALDQGYAARPTVDALRARAAALMPDVWR
jgi:hypothetical protein